MELTEPIESINKQLIEEFGIDSITGRAMWRVVWSEDQFEKRKMEVTDEGLQLLHPEVREVPKYRQWVKERFVLENLTIIPVINQDELPTSKYSYEPIWIFETQAGVYLPPKFEAAKLVVDAVYIAKGRTDFVRYKDPDSDTEEAKENHKKRVDGLVADLFGNETETGDALAHGEAIVVPGNYEKVH